MKEKIKAFYDEHSDDVKAVACLLAIVVVSTTLGAYVGALVEDKNWYKAIALESAKRVCELSSK